MEVLHTQRYDYDPHLYTMSDPNAHFPWLCVMKMFELVQPEQNYREKADGGRSVVLILIGRAHMLPGRQKIIGVDTRTCAQGPSLSASHSSSGTSARSAQGKNLRSTGYLVSTVNQDAKHTPEESMEHSKCMHSTSHAILEFMFEEDSK